MVHKSKKGFLVLLLLIAGSLGVHAQFRLPPFDVELKVSQALIPAFGNNYGAVINLDALEATNIHGAAHLQLGQHIGIGWLYSRSFRGAAHYSYSGGSQSIPKENAYLLMSGPDLRISSGRGKKSRFYLSLNYTQVEFVDDKGGYRLAHKTNALGANIGLMRRLSNTVYFNIIELGAKKMFGEKAFWLNSDLMIEAKTGFTINFSKRK